VALNNKRENPKGSRTNRKLAQSYKLQRKKERKREKKETRLQAGKPLPNRGMKNVLYPEQVHLYLLLERYQPRVQTRSPAIEDQRVSFIP
jgi:hypothetical protein